MQRDDGFLLVRSVWISDLHLGTPGCQAHALLDFLRDVHCDTLYLVGDIIDGWQLRRSWYWPQAHNDVVQKLLRKARKGTRVIFVPGNHDEFARRYVTHNFGGVVMVPALVVCRGDRLRSCALSARSAHPGPLQTLPASRTHRGPSVLASHAAVTRRGPHLRASSL